MIVREATPLDIPGISWLIINTLRASNSHDYTPEAIEVLVARNSPRMIGKVFSKWEILVAEEENGKLIGTASLDSSQVRSVFVDSNQQMKGFGRELMNRIEEMAAKNNEPKLFLDSSVTAVGFYTRLGYKAKGRAIISVDDVPLQVIRMEKNLNNPV